MKQAGQFRKHLQENAFIAIYTLRTTEGRGLQLPHESDIDDLSLLVPTLLVISSYRYSMGPQGGSLGDQHRDKREDAGY